MGPRHRRDRRRISNRGGSVQLLTNLQIVELNEKDAHDAVYLLAAYPVRAGDEPGTIGLDRLAAIVGDDWGWWCTVTRNLAHLHRLARDRGREFVPAGAAHDVVSQLDALMAAAETAPKSLRWKLRARVGEKKRWYRIPQEDSHD